MKILHTSTDASVSNTQTMILAHAFPAAEIVGAVNGAEVTQGCLDSSVDLFIISASLDTASKVRYERALRVSCPQAKIVEFYYFVPETSADFAIPAGVEPKETIRILQELMNPRMAMQGTA